MMDCFDRLINYNATFNIMIKRCLVFSRLKGETKKYFIFFISLEFFPRVCNTQQRIIALHLWQFLSVVEIFILRPFGVCCTVQSNESRHETAVDYTTRWRSALLLFVLPIFISLLFHSTVSHWYISNIAFFLLVTTPFVCIIFLLPFPHCEVYFLVVLLFV